MPTRHRTIMKEEERDASELIGFRIDKKYTRVAAAIALAAGVKFKSRSVAMRGAIMMLLREQAERFGVRPLLDADIDALVRAHRAAAGAGDLPDMEDVHVAIRKGSSIPAGSWKPNLPPDIMEPIGSAPMFPPADAVVLRMEQIAQDPDWSERMDAEAARKTAEDLARLDAAIAAKRAAGVQDPDADADADPPGRLK